MSLPKVLIGDHHPVVLAGLRSLLQNSYAVVGEARDGRSLVATALSLRPDLIILSIGLPRLNGIDAARQIKARWPAARLLFFTIYSDTNYLRNAIEAGGAGYLLKTSTPEEIKTGIEGVLRGERYITPAFDPDILEGLKTRTRKAVPLSGRQREILQLITEGLSNKEIAAMIGLSVKTVEFHRLGMMQRLRVRSAAELAAAAVRNHLVVRYEPEALAVSRPRLDRKALEELWRARMGDAKQHFDLASLQVKEIQRVFGSEVSADGNIALAGALGAQNRALAEYNRVLRVYTDLTVNGKIPDEEPGE